VRRNFRGHTGSGGGNGCPLSSIYTLVVTLAMLWEPTTAAIMLASMQEGWGGKWLRGLTTILDLGVLAALSSLWNLWYYIHDGKRWGERACGSVWARHNMHGESVMRDWAVGTEHSGIWLSSCTTTWTRHYVSICEQHRFGSKNLLLAAEWLSEEISSSWRPPTNICKRERRI
jgi:hypothetical protein